MEKTEIVNIVNAALAREFELEAAQLVPEARFNADLGLDSLDAVDMIVVLEQAFKVKIRANYDPARMATLGGLYDFIGELLQKEQGGGAAVAESLPPASFDDAI